MLIPLPTDTPVSGYKVSQLFLTSTVNLNEIEVQTSELVIILHQSQLFAASL